MGKKKKTSEANHKRGTLPAGAVANGMPGETAASTAEQTGDAQNEAEVSVEPARVSDSLEKPVEPEPEKSVETPEATIEPEPEKPVETPEAVADSTEPPDPGFKVLIEHGYCDICEKEVDFRIDGEFLRNHFLCTECKSLPRQRAFLHVLKMCRPDWRTACMHESSPGGPSSDYLFQHAENYSISHYYPELPSGTIGPEGAICEDLEKMSYPDNVFDVFITQDVMEHIFDISAAFNEVKRVLKPGGFFLFTVPYYKDLPTSFRRAKRMEDGSIRYLTKAIYHGNPVDEKGALVTWDYGRDFPDLVAGMCGLHPVLLRVESRYHGLDGEMMEVFLMRKPRKKIDPSKNMSPASVFPDIPSEGQPFMTPFYDILPPEEEKTEEENAPVEEASNVPETAGEEETPAAAEHAPVETEPAPAETEPAPVETEPSGTEPAPAEPEPAPVENETVPAEDATVEEPSIPAH